MILVYLFFARNFVVFPYIVVSGHFGVERGASFVCVYDNFVPLAVLRVKVARRVVAFIPYNKVFYSEVTLDLLFEKINLVAPAKHIKRGVFFHYIE